MSTTFELEAKYFEQNFCEYTEKKIVLYGIGRRTASLVNQNTLFNFVGLMDRDEDNVGRVLYGIPVISLSEAEQKADMIIINAPETYWKIIYKRILDSKIPVYFTNGELAGLDEDLHVSDDPYWEKNQKDFEDKLKEYEVISFDMFDTLVSRTVLRPEDVFEIVENKINDSKIVDSYVDFVVLRNRAITAVEDPYYTIDDIYEKMQMITGWDKIRINRFREIELEVEKSLIIPRKEIINICANLLNDGKNVYIISDMYYSSHVLAELLENCGLIINENKIIVSCEQKSSKKDGGIWKSFKENIVREKRAIHIGDNKEADVEQPARKGIDTYYLMSIENMFRMSSIGELYGIVENVKESLIVGKVISELFNNPFQLGESKGKVCFSSREMWGYCVWGPVIFLFVQWLVRQSYISNIKKLVFFARDGYLLQKDYDYYCELIDDKEAPEGAYLYISRRIAYVNDIRDKKDFIEWMEFPYIGKFKDFLEDRFNIKAVKNDEHADKEIQMPKDTVKVWEWILPYMEDIRKAIYSEQRDYLQFLKEWQLDAEAAVVDIGYHGNIQRKLGRILGKELMGFYFYCDLSPDNECCKCGKMIPCFQGVDDMKASETFLFRYPQLLESLFTAPYGMIKALDAEGNMICSQAGENQRYFQERLEINEGVKRFLRNIVNLGTIITVSSFNGEEKFVDRMFGVIMENSLIASDISEIFYWDDAIVQRRENGIFF